MRFANRSGCTRALVLGLALGAASSSSAETLVPVHQKRYCMGTIFDIAVYHASRPDAERAVASAMAEISRLDQVMSHFKGDSDLSALNRDARRGFVTVEPSLFEVIHESLMLARRSGGTFDVTIAPLLRAWKQAQAEGRRPSAAEISEARRCVGFGKIEVRAPDRIRFHSDCTEIDLGGIGKGYAVDRAMAVLKAAGIQHAAINAGSSSIRSIGHPPGANGWAVKIGAGPVGKILLLKNSSISTSQQDFVTLARDAGEFAEILDPEAGAPAGSRMMVSVVAPTATLSDALSTTVLMLSAEESATLLAQYADVSAFWTSLGGEVMAAYRESGLQLSDSR